LTTGHSLLRNAKAGQTLLAGTEADAMRPERQDPQQFLEWTFELDNCPRCGGDPQHHTVVPSGDGWAAVCTYPRDTQGFFHPVIAAFHREHGAGRIR
jgi:hypothetical protein